MSRHMKTLIFGGTFDPPHRGHAALLKAAARKIRPDRILVVPAYLNPIKTLRPMTSPRQRAELTQLALVDRLPRRWRKRARVDTTELLAKRLSFTVDTLERLHKLRPADELHFALGSDAAANFLRRWKDPERLRALATWWYGRRASDKSRVPSFFRRLAGRFPDVSSTRVRIALSLGEDCSDLLFPEISDAIVKKGLYGTDLVARLRETLKPGRFEHTLNVAALADALAWRHGVDSGKARLAGLLHDAGRRFAPPVMAAYARKHRLKIPLGAQMAESEPLLLHAFISEHLARTEFGIKDAAVLSAIRNHTLGDPQMSKLDRIVYVADACSADRTYPGADKIRALAFRDIDEAFESCVAVKLSHALSRRAWIHPLTIQLLNSLAVR